MAASTQISVEEYLKTVYCPDRDYVDGVVEERNLGERDHSWIQGLLVTFFMLDSWKRESPLFPTGAFKFAQPDFVFLILL
ncbi:MAG: hypothetical protein ACJ74Z_09810 [Bryobacteraceae bacterium]